MRRVDVPSESWYDPAFNADLHTGRNAIEAAQRMPVGSEIATDIETPGLDRNFTINCVTVSWQGDNGRVQSVLLDPARDLMHTAMVVDLYGRASKITLHNAAFDVPPLWHANLIDSRALRRVTDTVLLARFAYPDAYNPITGSKKLENLAVKLLGLSEVKGGMNTAFSAAGYRTIDAGYENMDIDSPIYRRGAMTDTIATLQLEPLLRGTAIKNTLDHPFSETGATTFEHAQDILHRQEVVNHVMLRRSAVGLNVDMEYLDTYREQVDGDRHRYAATLAAAGLEGGSGKGAALVQYLFDQGELPDGWPRTKTGKLQATKDLLEGLDHPLAEAQRALANTDKVIGYLEKVSRQASVTGRCHPQVAVLGASATGRMSYGSPELQQFPKDARAIICDDGQGLTSIDWSQIEPVTMALMAKDDEFLLPFEAGEDLYEPIQRACGIDRPLAKVILLATMYGQGDRSMAKRIGHTEESAAQIRRQMLAAMPKCRDWMARIESIALAHGKIVTAGGRILPVDQAGSFRAVNYICVSPSTRILTSDLRHVNASTVSVGDKLVGFDENRSQAAGKGTGKRFYRQATVEDVRTFVRPGVRITAGGRTTECSVEHMWLVRCPTQNVKLQWVRADELIPGYHQMLSIGVWDTDDSRNGGYLAGLYDGEGCLLSTRKRPALTFSQNPGAVMDSFIKGMTQAGLKFAISPRTPGSTSPTDNARIHGLSRVMRTVGVLRPERFIERSAEIFDGVEMHTTRQLYEMPTVESVHPVGMIDVVSIQTSTRTMVADGYLSHNCQGSAYDVLANAIYQADLDGISDHIQLAMHDELVVDTEVAEHMQQIMLTPPDFLVKWAGRQPILRTDRADMGHAWAKV